MFAHSLNVLAGLAHTGSVPHAHPHEAPAVIALVLIVLALATLAARTRNPAGRE